jgi:hypothetical protein
MDTQLPLVVPANRMARLNGGLVDDLRRAAEALRRHGSGDLATALTIRAESIERVLRSEERTPPEVWLG